MLPDSIDYSRSTAELHSTRDPFHQVDKGPIIRFNQLIIIDRCCCRRHCYTHRAVYYSKLIFQIYYYFSLLIELRNIFATVAISTVLLLLSVFHLHHIVSYRTKMADMTKGSVQYRSAVYEDDE